jgi:hypothetical protein
VRMPVKITAGLFWALLLAATGLTTFYQPAATQSPTTLYTVPSPINLTIGQAAAIDVWVGNAANVSGYTVQLDFDPQMVQVLDADPALSGVQVRPGNFFAASQTHTTVNLVNNTYGRLIYAISLSNPTAPLFGNGILISFDLQAVGSGTSSLSLSQSELLSPDGNTLSITVQNPQVFTGATPTPTSSPTAPAAAVSTETAPPTSIPPATFTAAATLPVAATAEEIPGSDSPVLFLPIVAKDLHSPEVEVAPLSTATAPPASATSLPSPAPSLQPSATPLPAPDTPYPAPLALPPAASRTTAWIIVIVVVAGVFIAVGINLINKRLR